MRSWSSAVNGETKSENISPSGVRFPLEMYCSGLYENGGGLKTPFFPSMLVLAITPLRLSAGVRPVFLCLIRMSMGCPTVHKWDGDSIPVLILIQARWLRMACLVLAA